MNETELITAIRNSGVSAQVVAAVGIVWISWRVRVLESRLDAVAKIIGACPTCRRKFPAAALCLLLAFILFLCGCVQTTFRHGDATLTRTALLTHVTVPNIEVGTNGTFKASIDSDARTELIESVLRALSAAAK